MKTPVKLGLYGLGLVAVFLASIGAGAVAGPAPEEPTGGHDDGGHGGPAAATVERIPGGLQVAQDGYRFVPVTTTLPVGVPSTFAFRILGPDNAPLTSYVRAHDKDLHLIVVRRDLSGFQHVHPERGADGVWSVPLRVQDPGQYRFFADFQPTGRDKSLTLGVDVPAAGDYRPTPLPAPSRTATVDGYTVELTGELAPGKASRLTLSVHKGGTPVTDLDPYLGAYGHLVALRAGDLAYLHVHPEGSPGYGKTAAGPSVTFVAEVPSTGTYRLYLDFQHGGVVRTAMFTVTAGAEPAHGHP
jgi:hypothetical protein